MKKTHKQIFGLLGLGLVVATTAFAATLPNDPAAFAATQFTDSLLVRVVNSDVSVSIDKPEDGSTFTSPNIDVVYSYANSKTITVTLEYTGMDHVTHTIVLVYDPDVNYQSDTKTLPVNLADYGYGDFKINVKGEDSGGVPYEDEIGFSYFPVEANSEQEEGTSEVTVNLEYNTDPGSDIATIEVIIYNEDGTEEVGRATVPAPGTSAAIDFGEWPSGTYLAQVIAYDENGNELYLPYTFDFEYVAPGTPVNPDRPVVPVPNTGSATQGANISATDYLITGLIIFGIIAAAGIAYMVKNNKRTGKTNRRK